MALVKNPDEEFGSTLVGAARAFTYLLLMFLLWIAQFTYRWLKPESTIYVIQCFYRTVLFVMGFRIRVHGAISQVRPTFFVSNHTSYLDVPILGSVIPASFVAKAEVRGWPIIGMLCARQRTVFIERRATRIADQRNELREHLDKGESLILFPEGTSSDGLAALPFKSSFFSTVEGTHTQVQPVSIICAELDGMPITRAFRMLYAWVGDMDFAPHLWKVFKRGHLTVDIVFHAPVDPKAFPDRKVLAAYCQQQVAHGIEQSLAGRGISTADKPALPVPAKMIGA
ncbi:MAG TPA: lysophospholipid acyltransferase family protein [Alphaproteobacteria bacterium]|nr:lysophospholipid acyltransferase family protein [Alphaproteobacteria bacterium]